MRTIHKYPFSIKDKFTVAIPKFSRVIHVEVQGEQGPCMWAEVDTEQPLVDYPFRVYSAGHEIPERDMRLSLIQHVATFQQHPFVWHLYRDAIGR